MSVVVQVFGRLQDDPTRVRRREASEKRQGTKSREVARLRCGGLYGDLITAEVMAVEDWVGLSRQDLLVGGDRRQPTERKGVGG
jgi:hypothetical protein